MKEEAAWESRKLLRAARAGSLATRDGEQPFVSLVTPATAPDLSVLLLLSDLSPHTKHLRADPRCAVMVAGAPAEVNPQTAPRVTVTGVAEVVADEALKARYLALHPYAFYAAFGDFNLWRVPIGGAAYVGGFARAAKLTGEGLAPDPQAVAAIEAAAAGIMDHCNKDHPDAMARIAGGQGSWQMVAVDVDGCDVAQGEQVVRVAWSEPVSGPADVRRELVRLAAG